MHPFSTAALALLVAFVTMPLSANASIMGDLVDYDFTFYGSDAALGAQSCSGGCTASGQATVGAGAELIVGPFTLNVGQPAVGSSQITVNWEASSITVYAELLSGTTGQLTGATLLFSNLDWPGGLSEPLVSSSPGISSTITSFDATSFTASVGSFTFASPRTITYTLVPEPSTALLVGIGLAALAGRRRKMR
jgi:hypothetical protein